ncbi:rRNA maturation RNase YbeY [Flagellimonas sp. DF-77]|uniref:rRNA maturation RNase YbeY n=1 Tax=Flagellimonas algarum TaxID=3230298 RepID=UPI0033955F9F
MEIEYCYETEFELNDATKFSDWLTRVVLAQEKEQGTLCYVFCDDQYLLDINQRYLNHDTFTDIITFDYTDSGTISGDIFISIERVNDNAKALGVDSFTELLRVMVHGVLHLCGWKDKTEGDRADMRNEEDKMIKLFHVEH